MITNLEQNINNLDSESLALYSMILNFFGDDLKYEQLVKHVLKKATNGENIGRKSNTLDEYL